MGKYIYHLTMLFISIVLVRCHNRFDKFDKFDEFDKLDKPDKLDKTEKLDKPDKLDKCRTATDEDAAWTAYKQQYSKSQYTTPQEEALRRENWRHVSQLVAQHNELYNQGKVTYQMEVNFLADRTPDELSRLNGYKPMFYFNPLQDCFDRRRESPNRINKKLKIINKRQTYLPTNFNWTSLGAVTPVKDQTQSCLSCWAFAATGSLEGAYFKQSGILNSYSEQQLLDCTYNPNNGGNWGCNGGYYERAVQYWFNNGFQNQSTYPYSAIRGNCTADSNLFDRSYRVAQFCNKYGTTNNEDLLKSVLVDKWPCAAAMNVINNFYLYKSGVFSDSCSNNPESLNHAVLIVGYGTENGIDYWLVKNSWGTDWGDNGYFKIARNANNMCGIVLNPCFVELLP